MALRALPRSIVAFLFVIAFGFTAALSLGTATAQDSTPTASAPPCQEPSATPAASIDKDAIIATVTAEEKGNGEDEDATAEADPEAESTAIVDETPVCSATIEMVDIAFNPNQVTLPADQPVELVFHNTGKLPHDFTVEQLGIDLDADAGETESIVVSVPAGDYQFFCDEPGHAAAGMVGIMHVVDQG
jgi:uncharacterized cupredoxin-like copper-binding protein